MIHCLRVKLEPRGFIPLVRSLGTHKSYWVDLGNTELVSRPRQSDQGSPQLGEMSNIELTLREHVLSAPYPGTVCISPAS